MAAENYRKPYPRPFPCGSVLLGFDRRNAEMIGHRLDISNGLCEVYLLTKAKKKLTLQLFTDMTTDRLWFRLVDEPNAPALEESRFPVTSTHYFRSDDVCATVYFYLNKPENNLPELAPVDLRLKDLEKRVWKKIKQ